MRRELSIDNLKIDERKNYVLVSINPQIYPLDVVYSACYSLMDRAYVIIDGHPEEEILVELRPKKKMDLEMLGRVFNEELINYAFYKSRARENKTLREILMKAAFLSNVEIPRASQQNKIDYIDDPLGIARPWASNKQKNGDSGHEDGNNGKDNYKGKERSC